MRLLSGILVAQKKNYTITGTSQLLSRPMDRIVKPLKLMGAKIESYKNYAPLKIFPSYKLNDIKYSPKVASAQVKSAILLAGLYASKKTTIIEKRPTRNHTEIFLKSLGAKINIIPIANQIADYKLILNKISTL